RYSNQGYMLLGAIIEKKTGLSIAEAVKVHLLEPAGLKDTTGPKTGAGGLKTSIQDLARYASMWLSGGHIDGRQVIDPESIQDMLKNPLYTPAARNQFYTGRGWRVKIDENGVVTFFHIGGADYVAAWVQMFPRYGAAICYLGNPPEYTPPLEMYLAEMQKKLGRLATAYVGAAEPLYTWESEPAPPWIRDRVIGTYRNPLTGKVIRILPSDDGLRYRNAWGGGYYLYPFTTHIYRGGENWLTHDFIFDKEGHLEGMANGDGFYRPVEPEPSETRNQADEEADSDTANRSQ
ncbi:MAG: serine hydrolase, partial [Leptospiraceae bacterium]|nr:serine hydrolase [Leptospiraceae bacterium]